MDGWEAGGVFNEIFVWVSGKVMGGHYTHYPRGEIVNIIYIYTH